MKIVIVILIIILFWIIGFYIKYKYKSEYSFLIYLKNFYQYYISNVTLFKNNIVEVINNYIITHKNKNAKYNNIFIKNGNIYGFNIEILKYYILKKTDIDIIYNSLNNLGKSDYYFEKECIKECLLFLDKKLNESELNLKNKGELYFKLLLSIGVILAIIIWWFLWMFQYYLRLVQLEFWPRLYHNYFNIKEEEI